MGGVLFFYFIEAGAVSKVNYTADHKVSSITLKVGSVLSAGYSTPHMLAVKTDPSDSDQGVSYAQELKGFFPRPPAGLIAELYNMVNRKFIVLAKDSNGNARMLGTPEQPLGFSFSEDTGSRPGDLPGAAFSFSGNLYQPAYFYTAILNFPILTESGTGSN